MKLKRRIPGIAASREAILLRVKRTSALLLVVLACGRHDAPQPATASGADAALDAGAAVVAAADAGSHVEPPPGFAALVRTDRFDEAARTIDGLPAAERDAPDVRYARARIALELGDGATALTRLDGLEAVLPTLAEAILHARAEAHVLAGPPADAASYFAGHLGSAEDQLAAARAFVKAGDEPHAAKACAVVVGLDKRTRAQEAEARSIRLKLSSTPEATLATDARWLVVSAPDLSFAAGADVRLAKHDATHPLTGKELLFRARVLGDAGKLDDALAALGIASSLAPLEKKRAQADARMRARAQYMEAARLYLECATAKGGTAEDLLASARALSRADDDDAAITRYRDVVKKYPKAPQAADAAFLSARLEILHGRWAKAATALDDYLKRYAAGGDRDAASKLRAIARLGNGEHAVARKLFEAIAGAERDANTRGRFWNLAALAALRDGDKAHAVARWTQVATGFPLTWPALVARARLSENGAPLPPMIDPASTTAAAAPLAITLPPPVDLLTRVGLDGDAEAQLRSREGLLAGTAPGRSVEAQCIAYGMLGRGQRRMQVAQQIAAATVQTAPSAATKWAWECLFPEPFARIVLDAELKETLPRGLVHSVMRQESGFDVDVTSSARAVGLMQLLPETARDVAKELALPHDDAWLVRPSHNITLGAHYLHSLLITLGGSIPLAAAAYNAGPEAVKRWTDRMKGLELDALVEAIPYAETRGYVVRVMGNLARYEYLQAGEAGVAEVKLSL